MFPSKKNFLMWLILREPSVKPRCVEYPLNSLSDYVTRSDTSKCSFHIESEELMVTMAKLLIWK